MKKLKEFLMLLIPFAALSTLSVIWFAINTQGGVRYLQLMLADSFFIIALMHTFVPPIIISFIVCFFYKNKDDTKNRLYHFICPVIDSTCYLHTCYDKNL